MNCSECRGLRCSPDEDQRATGFGVTVEPMMRRPVHKRTFADVNARSRSAMHSHSNACLRLRRLSLAGKNSCAALHPIRLPRAVKGAASLVIDPGIIGNEIHARAVRGGIPRIQAAQAMDHSIECSLAPRGIGSLKNINKVIVRHKERSLLHGPG